MKTLASILASVLLLSAHLCGQCRPHSRGPNEIEYVSPHPAFNFLYYGISDYIEIRDPGCINPERVRSIVVTAKSNCSIEPIVPPYKAGILENASYHVHFLSFSSCEVSVVINDTITKTFKFYPKTIPLPHIDVSSEEISFVNTVSENDVLEDQSWDVIWWTPLKYRICIIDQGKMLYSGENTGTVLNPQLKEALSKAPKNAYILFYDVELEIRPSIGFKKEKYTFAYASAVKQF